VSRTQRASRLLSIIVVVAGIVWGAAVLRAGQEPAQPTFKASTSLVEVDIIARDKNGRFVSGLTADDFEVLEEGKPQSIAHFYLVTENPTASTEPRADIVIPRSPDRTDRRIFVFFFDSEHLSQQSMLKLKHAASDFVGDHLRRSDLAGVFVNGALVHNHLTNDRQELLDAIASVTPAFETADVQARALLDFPRIDSVFDATRIESGDNSFIQEVAIKACGDYPTQCALEGGREYVEDAVQRKARKFIADSRRSARTTVESLTYVTKNLSPLEGRKTLVFLSEGFYVNDLRGTLPVLAGQAARAGVTIYGIDARGTSAVAGVAGSDVTMQTSGLSGFGDTADEGLDILSVETGGLTFRHTDDFAQVLSKLAADTSTYYVLAYTPDNTVLDGKFRRITLKVKWEGLTVRARRGYVASPLPPAKQLRTGTGRS
jgi:VWFA-related protein